MKSPKIPRWFQCGIFSRRYGWLLMLPLALLGQQPDRIMMQLPVAGAGRVSPARQSAPSILALRVAFTPDSNLSTTGDGRFLMEIATPRCEGPPGTAFLVDPPPHDAAYFAAQL